MPDIIKQRHAARSVFSPTVEAMMPFCFPVAYFDAVTYLHAWATNSVKLKGIKESKMNTLIDTKYCDFLPTYGRVTDKTMFLWDKNLNIRNKK